MKTSVQTQTSFLTLCMSVAASALTLSANADTKTPQEMLVGKWLCTNHGTGSDIKTGFVNHISALLEYRSDGTYDASEVGYLKDGKVSGVYRMNSRGVWSVKGDTYAWQVTNLDSADYHPSFETLPYWQDVLESGYQDVAHITQFNEQVFSYRSGEFDVYCKRR